MNLVIYSYNFFPQADAESYCATRFASAMARAGHNVTVVTMDWPRQVSEKTYKALVADELKIVKVPFSKKKNSTLRAFWYGHKSQMAVDVSASARVVKQVLMGLEKPILMTRTHPVASLMVGYKVRTYAYKWISHLSDPIPWIGAYANTFGHKLLRMLEVGWLKKSFLAADATSVTCAHACEFYHRNYGKVFDNAKTFVTTHIGDYRLDARRVTPFLDKEASRTLIHPGSIYRLRGGLDLIKALNELNNEGFAAKMIQVGEVDPAIKYELNNCEFVKNYNTISPEKSVELLDSSKAVFVPDFESELDYSPFILSKFVYQIMGDKPMILYAKNNSEMHEYAQKFPEAGIFWADAGDVDSLKEAIKAALACDTSKIDRTAMRKVFAEESIVRDFEKNVASLG